MVGTLSGHDGRTRKHEIETFSAIIGVVSEVLTIALIVVSALAFMDSFKAIADGRKTKIVYPILILSLALVLLG